MQQVAQVFVLSFPHVPNIEHMLNLFAAEHDLPEKADLIEAFSEDPKEAEWTAFWSYCKAVDPDRTARYNYVPFIQATRH